MRENIRHEFRKIDRLLRALRQGKGKAGHVDEPFPQYPRRAGVEEIWIVDPFAKQVLAETKGPDGYESRTLTAGRLDSAVVPGFWIEADWLWPGKLPLTVACLRRMLPA